MQGTSFQIWKQSLDELGVMLVAVSKTHPIDKITQIYNQGQRDFGENKVNEMVNKHEALPEDIRWHMIGHLQTNKVKYIAPFVHLIQSVDSERLLIEINKQAQKNHRKISVLMEVYIAQENTKYGLDQKELNHIFQSYSDGLYPHIRIKGLMGMASNTADVIQIQNEFQSLKKMYDHFPLLYPNLTDDWTYLSMGMSGDYRIAIECGSNMIRVGSTIFGNRNYTI